MKNYAIIILSMLLLSGCASIKSKPDILEVPKTQSSPMEKELAGIPPIDGPRITIGIMLLRIRLERERPQIIMHHLVQR